MSSALLSHLTSLSNLSMEKSPSFSWRSDLDDTWPGSHTRNFLHLLTTCSFLLTPKGTHTHQGLSIRECLVWYTAFIFSPYSLTSMWPLLTMISIYVQRSLWDLYTESLHHLVQTFFLILSHPCVLEAVWMLSQPPLQVCIPLEDKSTGTPT